MGFDRCDPHPFAGTLLPAGGPLHPNTYPLELRECSKPSLADYWSWVAAIAGLPVMGDGAGMCLKGVSSNPPAHTDVYSASKASIHPQRPKGY